MKKFRRIFCLALATVTLVGLTACDEDPTKSRYTYENENASVNLTNSLADYTQASYSERAEILGLLEKYAVENHLTGLTLFGNGGYVMYADRIKKGVDTYIPGYGFGIGYAGSITADMANESNAAWKRYYHSYQSSDPKTLNYWNDKGSVVGDLTGYVHGGYWTTVMNSTKDGYDWIPDLAKTKPIAVNPNANGFATKYRWEVKVGEELKYNTLTQDSVLKAYSGRQVALEDYLTPFKNLHNKSLGLARGAEGLTGASSIKGMNAYYEATGSGYSQAAWDNVGLKAYVEGGKSYVEVEFNAATNTFYAMYYMASSLYTPIPQSFIDEIGGFKNYASYVKDSTRTPVDTTLSTSIYVLERWDEDQQIVFKRNPLYLPDSPNYKIAGYHFRILSAVNTDSEAAFKEFIAGNIDAVSIPSAKLQEYKSDPRTTTTGATSTTKMNMNTTTPQRWEELFGENGSIVKTAKEDYWDVKPAMSNNNFVKGLSFALNRAELANQTGRTPSMDFFSDNYLSDPENGISYNSTEAHKKAIASLSPEGVEFGYSLEVAKYYFTEAAKELTAAGSYKSGDKVVISIAWQTQANVTTYGYIAECFRTAFNQSDANTVYGLTLEIENIVPAEWSDVYYKHMMVGQFDLGFGNISGNSLNPLNFMDTLFSNNSSGFTLNWGQADTAVVDPSLVYDGRTWSFDDLYKAADSGFAVEGEEATPYGAVLKKSTPIADGSRTIEVLYATVDYEDKVEEEVTISKVTLTWGTNSVDVTYTVEDGIITITVPAATEAEILAAGGNFTITVTFDNIPSFENEFDEYGYVIGFDVTYSTETVEITTTNKK